MNVNKENTGKFCETAEELQEEIFIEELKKKAFLDGYRYAIQVLKDGLVGAKET